MKTLLRDLFSNPWKQVYFVDGNSGGSPQPWWFVRDVLLGVIIWYFWGVGAVVFSYCVACFNHVMAKRAIERVERHYERILIEYALTHTKKESK